MHAVRLFSLVCLMSGSQAFSSHRSSRLMGLTLNEWCVEGGSGPQFPCILLGSICVNMNSEGTGTCKCQTSPLAFEEAGSPPDRCVPGPTVPLDKGECEVDADCSRLVNTVCRASTTTPGKRYCACKDDHEPNTALAPTVSCKPVVCTTKPTNWCSDPTRPCSITDSVCIQATGKCGCPTGRSLILQPSGVYACIDPNSISCGTTSAGPSCPAIASGTTTCVNSKCTCQTSSKQGGTLKFIGGARQCTPNSIGSPCSRHLDCPDTVSCVKKTGVLDTDATKGICACGPYKRPRNDGPKSMAGFCCRGARDCGLTPTSTTDKAFACLKATVLDATGSCGCPSGSGWDGVSCKVLTTLGVCLLPV